MLSEQDKKEIQERLKQMVEPVKLKLFTQKIAGICQYCAETEQLLREVTDLSDLLSLDIYNFVTDQTEVEQYGIDKIPAIVIEGKEDFGMRFYGIPTGYEFATFLEAILKVSGQKSDLSQSTIQKLGQIDKSVHIQVFVTPTCPYCQSAALTAYQLAMESGNVRSDVVEVTEFPHLAQKYGVMGVPKIVINEAHSFEGALPENLFVEQVFNVVK
jgi:glutaredoxin-like protein